MTFPVRDGWSWPTGSSYVLSWKSSGVVQNVQIDCMRHGVFAFRIALGLLNCGAFPFTMPMDAPTGEGFQIRVRSVALKKACGMSASFSIIERIVAQAVPRRAPAQVVRKIVNVHGKAFSIVCCMLIPVNSFILFEACVADFGHVVQIKTRGYWHRFIRRILYARHGQLLMTTLLHKPEHTWMGVMVPGLPGTICVCVCLSVCLYRASQIWTCWYGAIDVADIL